MIDPRWNLTNPPPKGHEDVAAFAAMLFEIARQDKERLGKPNDFLTNYALYRGYENRQISGRKGFSPKKTSRNPVNLYFANVERTVSNITARVPTGEVVDMDGMHDEAEDIATMSLKKWWKDSDQQTKTRASARMMEIYGATIEKPVRDPDLNAPDVMITDPFAFFPAPGFWNDIATEAPFVCFLYQGYVDQIEKDFNVTKIANEEAYELLGQVREEFKMSGIGSLGTIGNYSTPMTLVQPINRTGTEKAVRRGIIIEVWLRDHTVVEWKTETPLIDDSGEQARTTDGEDLAIEKVKTKKVCPDGVRKITISKSADPEAKGGWVVLDDNPNPNLNYRHEDQGADLSLSYPWGRFPVYIANSYKDGVSIWGFAAAEQVGDLISKINIIVTKLIAYVINVMVPPLIVQQHCGITKEMIENSIQKSGRLILMPSTPNARIEFMQIPNLPSTFFQVLDMIVKFFDRVYQIEDADRGVGPTGVIAASAIVALQERNQVLMQTKSSAIDNLVEQRSRWAIGLWQNWGVKEDSVDVAGEKTPFRFVNFIGRRFNYIVESGSSTPKTSLQLQEMAKWLYEVKAIGQRGLLETVNWPGWKEEVQRTAGTQLDQALVILMDAGLPEEAAIALKQMLEQIKLQADNAKKVQNSGGQQPVQPKSLVPASSTVQPGM
jgi:hypothetical protein